MKNILILSIATAALTVSLSSCKKFADEKRDIPSTTSGVAKMACDQSFQHIMEQEIDVYEFQYPEASILDLYAPENDCIDSLLNGDNYRLAVVTRELTDVEKNYLKAKKRNPRSMRIAVDAVAVIANPKNPVEEISTSDLQKILSGEITEWNWVEPGNKTGKISVVFDDSRSSTVNYVVNNIMDGKQFGENVYAQGTNAKVFDAVSKTPGAIGIIGVSWLSDNMKEAQVSTEDLAKSLTESDNNINIEQKEFSPDIKVLAVSGPDSPKAYKPYQAYIFEKDAYPMVRSIYMITTGGPSTPAAGFYSFVTGVVGQKLITKTGVLPGQITEQVYEVH